MAGNWLKVEVGLPEKAEVWEMAMTLGVDPDLVVGKLIKVWRWFDEHTEDGNAKSVTYFLIDHVAGLAGFGEAMSFAGWLVQSGKDLVLPNFGYHNGQTAKNRALTAKRVAEHKAKNGNAKVTVGALPRIEKNRTIKEKPPIPPNTGTNGHDLLGDESPPKKTRAKREGLTFGAWIESLPEGVMAIPATDSVFSYADKAHIPRPFLKLAWIAFETRMTDGKKVQKDWPAHFRNAVKNDWLKLWRFNAAGECYLTTAGKQLEASSAETEA